MVINNKFMHYCLISFKLNSYESKTLKRKLLFIIQMSTVKSINDDEKLGNRILHDLLSNTLSLPELSKKYNIDVSQLFLWLKSVEVSINQTLNSSSDIFPPVDDEEWLNMTTEERNEFFNDLEEGLKFKSETYTLDDLKKMKENIKHRHD